MNDLTGPLVTTIRDDTAVAAITTRVRGAQLAQGDTAPAVVVTRATQSRSPFGPGRRRLGKQQPLFYVKVFGSTYQQAEQLAGAVSDALNLRGHQTISSKYLDLITDEGWGAPVLDPVTNWPTIDLTFQVTGNA